MLFYEVDEELGVLGIGGVARFLEADCPSLVVVAVQVKQCLVTLSLQELGVVVEGSFGMLVAAETLIGFVVIGIVGFTVPVAGTFYAEVVVGFACQCAVSAARFQYALRQCDAGGYAISLHLLAGYFFVGSYILLGGHFVSCSALLAVQLAVA